MDEQGNPETAGLQGGTKDCIASWVADQQNISRGVEASFRLAWDPSPLRQFVSLNRTHTDIYATPVDSDQASLVRLSKGRGNTYLRVDLWVLDGPIATYVADQTMSHRY